jgi:hypothetical protein
LSYLAKRRWLVLPSLTFESFLRTIWKLSVQTADLCHYDDF